MAYDEELADRIRETLAIEPGVSERRMFGGLAFLLGGHLTVAVSGQGGLMLRVDPGRSADYVAQSGVERIVMRGREMDGWLRVDRDVVETDEALRVWVDRGVEFVGSLPAKGS